MNDKTIAICAIATGKYDIFVKPFVDSLANFCPNHKKVLYLFTDNTLLGLEDYGIEHKTIYVVHKPFPYPTLHRYEWMGIAQPTEDYMFYLDIDMKVINVGDEILNDLTAVRHPFYEANFWSNDKRSKAYTTNPRAYFCGGVQGGLTENYLPICLELSRDIDIDEKNGIVAKWHDESHWNRYLSEHDGEFVEMGREYCCPESDPKNVYNIKESPRIIALDKDHDKVRY